MGGAGGWVGAAGGWVGGAAGGTVAGGFVGGAGLFAGGFAAGCDAGFAALPPPLAVPAVPLSGAVPAGAAVGGGADGFAGLLAVVPVAAGAGGAGLPLLEVGAEVGAPPSPPLVGAVAGAPVPLEAPRAAAAGGACGFAASTASLVAVASALDSTTLPFSSTTTSLISTHSWASGSQRQPSCSMTWSSAATAALSPALVFHVGAGAVSATPAQSEPKSPRALAPVSTRVATNRVFFFVTLIIVFLLILIAVVVSVVVAVVVISWSR